VLDGFEADTPASYGVDRVADAAGLARLRDACRRVRVEPTLVGYIAAIVRATRTAPVLTLGASPRASVALLKMAQASALLEGRAFVIPDDVKALAPAVLRHLVTVAPELELEGVAPDVALRGIIEKIEAPR
jgi:MoxR-like ATPase